jgi:hypothetical protein
MCAACGAANLSLVVLVSYVCCRGADRYLASALAEPELREDAALIRDGCVLLQVSSQWDCAVVLSTQFARSLFASMSLETPVCVLAAHADRRRLFRQRFRCLRARYV